MNAVRIELILPMLGMFSDTHKHTHSEAVHRDTWENERVGRKEKERKGE